MGATAAPATQAAKPGKDPNRYDPKLRPIDGGASLVRLKNRQADRFYILVQEHGVVPGEHDVDYYLDMAEALNLERDDGYEVELKTPTGVSLGGGKTTKGNGEPIRFRGCILLSCPMDFKKLIEEVGVFGAGGQRGADAQDKLYRKRGSYADTSKIAGGVEGIKVKRNMRQTDAEGDEEQPEQEN